MQIDTEGHTWRLIAEEIDKDIERILRGLESITLDHDRTQVERGQLLALRRLRRLPQSLRERASAQAAP